jgi:serine/threonine protein phosphatase 1
MRKFAIGDIHGCLTALDAILDEIAPQADDLVVTLGDYIDRGPNSKGVVDRIVALGQHCRCVSLKGNHELMMLAARNDEEHFREWLACGGKEALKSYQAVAQWPSFADSIPAQHWQFFKEGCKAYYVTRTHLFVHANICPDLPLSDQPDYMLYWERLEPAAWRPHESGKTLICGHSVQRSGCPLVLDHAVCIDTWVYGDGWLTCLDVESGTYWQANDRGKKRKGKLAD